MGEKGGVAGGEGAKVASEGGRCGGAVAEEDAVCREESESIVVEGQGGVVARGGGEGGGEMPEPDSKAVCGCLASGFRVSTASWTATSGLLMVVLDGCEVLTR